MASFRRRAQTFGTPTAHQCVDAFSVPKVVADVLVFVVGEQNSA